MVPGAGGQVLSGGVLYRETKLLWNYEVVDAHLGCRGREGVAWSDQGSWRSREQGPGWGHHRSSRTGTEDLPGCRGGKGDPPHPAHGKCREGVLEPTQGVFMQGGYPSTHRTGSTMSMLARPPGTAGWEDPELGCGVRAASCGWSAGQSRDVHVRNP